MTAWMWQMIGFDAATSQGQVRTWSLEFAGLIGPFAGAVLIVGLCLAAWMLYRRQSALSQTRKWVLMGLRGLAMVVLVLLAMQPTLVMDLTGAERSGFVLLVDASQSMNVRDMGSATRAQYVNQNLLTVDSPLLKELRKTHEVQVMSFGREVCTLEGELVADQEQTRLADALDAAGRRAGAGGAVLVVTDGRQTSDQDALSAAMRLAQVPVTVFALGVGSVAPRDVAVALIDVPEIGFAREKTVATVRLIARSAAASNVTVRLMLGDQTVATRQLTIDRDGAFDLPMEFSPQVASDLPLVAVVEGVSDDLSRENDRLSRPWQVVDRKLRVLVIEGEPRFEYRFLVEVLRRDRRVETKLFLTSASPVLAEAPGSDFLARFPDDARGISGSLGEFDLVILGDVPVGAINTRQQQMLADFVTQLGGALVVMPRRNRCDLWRRTVIEGLLPVYLASGRASIARTNSDTSLGTVAGSSAELAGVERAGVERAGVELTSVGQQSPMLRLDADESKNVAIWQELAALDWVAAVDGVKPAADVLVQRVGTGEPVIVQQQVGAGQVLWIGTDALWRFRRNAGDRYHAAIWGQIVQRLALPRVLAGGKLSRVTPDRRVVQTGQSVVVTASIFSESFEPITQPVLTLTVGLPDGVTQTIELLAVAGRPGQYRGIIKLQTTGAYDLSLAGVDALPRRVWAVNDPDELRDVALNEALLKQITQATGGELFTSVEQLRSLASKLEAQAGLSSIRVRVALWSSGLAFILATMLLALEWFFRRSWQLK